MTARAHWCTFTLIKRKIRALEFQSKYWTRTKLPPRWIYWPLLNKVAELFCELLATSVSQDVTQQNQTT